MSSPHQPVVDLPHLYRMLTQHYYRWLVPTVVLTAIAVGYAATKSNRFEVTQALIVREEAVGTHDRPGHFVSLETMQTAHETALELAYSNAVLEEALKTVGPENGRPGADWPTSAAIGDLHDSISLKAPNGSEFGKTEVIYLSVESNSNERATALANAICKQLDHQLRELRKRRAQGVVDELTRSVSLATEELAEATSRLSKIEKKVGSDLGELRILNESAAGESNLRQSLIAIQSDIRGEQTSLQTTTQLVELLANYQKSPEAIKSAPIEMLNKLPALRQLKDGLVAAQLQTADISSERTEYHPKVIAARQKEMRIQDKIVGELSNSSAELIAEINVTVSRIESLKRQHTVITRKMATLADIRAGYGNLAAEVKHRENVLQQTQAQLSTALANRAAAGSASVLTLVDSPRFEDTPAGPSRSTIALLGMFGGLATGLGVLLLTTPISPNQPATINLPGLTVGMETNVTNTPASSETESVERSVWEQLSRPFVEGELSFQQVLSQVRENFTALR